MKKNQTASLIKYQFKPEDLIINGYDHSKNVGNLATFNQEAANRPIIFCEEYLTHISGALAGQPMILTPWLRAIFANMYGWIRPDGTRLIRSALIYVPKKNNKTTGILAPIGLYELFCGGEQGNQIASCAGDQAQAALTFDIMKGMCENSVKLSGLVGGIKGKILKGTKGIEYYKTKSKYRALSSESKTKNGLGTNIILADELHTYPNRDLLDNLQTGSAARKQPLLIMTTTSDYYNPTSPCNMIFDKFKKIRDGVISDPTALPCLWYAEVEDDWTKEETWKKANPNYGLSVNPVFFEEQVAKAKNEPSFLNEFLRLHLNVQTNARNVWLSGSDIEACKQDFTPEVFKDDNDVYGGIDLSATIDLTAFVLFSMRTKHLYPWFFMPRDTAIKRQMEDNLPYLDWAKKGYLILTEGNVVDYPTVREYIMKVTKEQRVKQWGIDPHNATESQQLLIRDGVNIIEFRPGPKSMNAPSKLFEVMLKKREIKIANNPILINHFKNCQVQLDAMGNVSPTKEYTSSTSRIDGAIAAIISIGMASNNPISNGKVWFTWA